MVSNKGEYKVGTKRFSITDENRKETLGLKEGSRKIAVRIYYPADSQDVEGKEKAAIFSDAKAEALSKAYHIKSIASYPNEADYYENVKPFQDKKFPMIFYNHGYNSYMEANSFLCCELASHGYIVASVGHAYEAIETDYEDGSIDLYDKILNKTIIQPYFSAIVAQMKLLKKKNPDPQQAYDGFNQFQKQYASFLCGRLDEWAQDTLMAHKAIKERFSEQIDFSNGIGATGHSFGGAVAYYLCQYEKEFSCGINIDGAPFGDYGDKIMEKPFYQICCRSNLNLETKPLLNRTAPVYYAIFNGMKHIGFADAKFFIKIGNMTGKLPAETMHENLAACHIGFFDKYLYKKEDAVIGQSNDAVEFRSYE